ncbi:similar to Saccharomyces cerevisiae YER168C CCA1 ATP (CTP):tRNA-specific tRNA nucleotidyltransferase [Maudiozyma barnettii]|uniref:CCA tRNA nucleotidyltransferase, mitochondrial n=1 Tax=Maudiozyma barnettii TaxID=61262 RepID=A0A8H2ZI49_9SACH|nr:tRNA adenylyltransferase [Kazachstania barnettii]CAB4255503.1 similar to Saccharomyces cerevisiae YER168C CCA1 ATP (CTP):tRNA-specific tRNA nucleotidyltransferase [Kazachstania barnettii]CAD1784002.1 similar to Saccharomyces cerevisiae YER168C CCA1 ATP (CTP):tRNA-specific tRNA nucleotidyltransferase [Kazachstania barnettii]
MTLHLINPRILSQSHKLMVMMSSSASSSLRNNVLVPKIQLTEKESQICKVLKDFTKEYNSHSHIKDKNNNGDPLTLRITGGWVRDKLLGQGSHDLDIAVNNMTGEQFAMSLNDYLVLHYSKYGITPHSIHRIEKNPEKSKHLETATTRLFDTEIDFVNLRSEEYSTISRIPTIAFGTPKQDALRRDATLNALFYNVQNETIEDLTGKGIQDLKAGLLRTPLPARQTFLDDPLRVLRLIRFAARFDFKIVPDVLQEMGDPEINIAFDSKISKERIGNEMEKILKGPNPNIALHLIQKCHLENVVFFWHHDITLVELNQKQLGSQYVNEIDQIYSKGILNKHLLNFWNQRLNFLKENTYLQEKVNEDPIFKQNYILAVALLPFSQRRIIAFHKKKLNNTMSVVESIVREGLKLNKMDGIIVGKCVDSISKYHQFVTQFIADPSSVQRSDLGLFIRSFESRYLLAHYVSLMNEYLKETNPQRQIQLIAHYNDFYQYVKDQDLLECHNLRPMIDGKKLLKLLNVKSGPWMGLVNNDIIVWQLDHPQGTEEQLLDFVKEILPKYIK